MSYDYTYKPDYNEPPPKPFPTRKEIINGVECEITIYPPNGLMVLRKAKEMYIKLESDWRDVYGMKASKKYGIYNQHGRRMYYALEYSVESNRFCIGRSRPFKVHILDCRGKVAMIVRRKCTPSMLLCCCQCLGNVITIHSGYTGELHGTVIAIGKKCRPTYLGYDGEGKLLFTLKNLAKGFTRPFWGKKVAYRIYGKDDEEERSPLGLVHHLFTGLGMSLFLRAYQFGAYFDRDWDCLSKAVLLGGMFGIGFLDYPQKVYV